MKKLIFIYLIICLIILQGCILPKTDEETIIITDPTIETPSESIVPSNPTVVPSDPPLVTPHIYTISIIKEDIMKTIDSNDLERLNLQEIEILDSFGKKNVLLGYRLTDILKTETYDGVTIHNQNGKLHFMMNLSSIYLFIGEIEANDHRYYEFEDYHISRVQERKITSSVIFPSQINLRTVNPNTAIYYIEYRAVSGRYDHHTSLRALQGIINRNEPKLLTVSTGNPYYKHSDHTWLNYIEFLGYDLIELHSLEEVIYRFKDYFNGIITFRDRFKSYNNWVSAESDFALMMASVNDFAPVPAGLENTISNLTGLPIITSFETNGKTVNGDISAYLNSKSITDAYMVYEHVFHEFKEAFNTKSYMSLTSEVMDYAASEKMMFFDLKATQSARDNLLSQQINQYFDNNNTFFNVYGWVDHESSALDFISSYGGVIDVVGNGNLSLLSRLPIDAETFKQKAVYHSTYNTQKKYVTFFASESDTIKVGVAFQHGAWLDPNRGKVPINWGLISDMSVEFPFVYDYFIQTATEKDYFYSGGGSAIGFVDIDSQMSLTSRNAIAQANAYYLNIADQSIIDMYNDRYTPTDLFEKNVIGAYLLLSQVEGAFARIHDSNTSIRVETWNSVPVYNRWTNFYPRRPGSSEVNLSNMSILNSKHLISNQSSNYWFIETDLSQSQNKIGFELFRQNNGDGYQVLFSQGRVYLKRVVGGIEEVLHDLTFNTTTRKVKVSVDQSSPIDLFPRIKLYVNDLKVIEYYDLDNTYNQGGFGLFSDDQISTTFNNLTGSKWSMWMAIYNRIIQDSNRFIMAYYGFVGTEEYTNAQYRTEPGIGGVISLSPTDFYKIKLMLDINYPNIYEIVHANEFLEYAKTYQAYYGNLR